LSTHSNPDSDAQPPRSVSEIHSRALSAHFKTVEEYLRVVDAWLDGYDGVFYGSRAELAIAERARVRALIAEILGGLRQLRAELALQPLETTSLGVIRAYLSELWISLVETRGRYLRGYGEVPADLAAYLDRRVDALESKVNEIRRIVEAAADSDAGTQRAELSKAPGQESR
jgi:hypothetical protein